MIDRSWSRRPLVSPGRFAQSIPRIWATTSVSFERRVSTPNSIGGMGAAAPAIVLTVNANVSIEVESTLQVQKGDVRDVRSGPAARRFYTILFASTELADPPTVWPQKGDIAIFTDAKGLLVRTPVAAADVPESIADHWELTTEEIE